MATAHGTQVELPKKQSGNVSQSQIVKGLKCYAAEFGLLTSGAEQVTKKEVGWYVIVGQW